ncbi:synaptic vesicle glycoprotein 2C-like isoform X2 [Bacillus rossius redtenbacheri]|uniref:synaptic vesicle glycoprotein 2C-like isoform X2 n=1 Tax=Bacillus rossius redtenbacheri TaxID=93214 RepID=UPI002FDEC9E8
MSQIKEDENDTCGETNLLCDERTPLTGAPDQSVSGEGADFETALSLTGYGKFHICLMLASFPGVMTNLFDSSVMSYVLPSAVCDLQLSNFDKGVLNAITYGGMICSAFMWGFLSDSLGRQRLLVAGFFLDAAFNLLSSFSQGFGALVALRFVCGFIISGPHAMLLSFLAEFHSEAHRARMIILTGVYGAIAYILVPGLAWVIIPKPWSWSLLGGRVTYNSWRVFVAVCSLPSLLAGGLMLCFDESPKFLVSRGRLDEALQVLQNMYSVNSGRPPDTYPVKYLQLDRVQNKPSSKLYDYNPSSSKIFILLESGWKQVKPLFKFPHIMSAVLVFSIQFGSMFSLNTIRLWMPQMFFIMEEFDKLQDNSTDGSLDHFSLCEMVDFSEQLALNHSMIPYAVEEPCSVNVVKSQMYLNSVIVGLVTGAVYLCAGALINTMGRKRLLIVGFVSSTICAAYIYWSRNTNITIAVISVFLAASSVTGKAVVSVVVDLFPTSLRAMAVSLTMMFGRSGSLIGNLIFPALLDLNCSIPFFLVSGITLFCSCLSSLLPIRIGKNSS